MERICGKKGETKMEQDRWAINWGRKDTVRKRKGMKLRKSVPVEDYFLAVIQQNIYRNLNFIELDECSSII